MRRELARHSLQVIAKGLELHAWKEPQLIALQQQLRDDDFLALHADALRCGRALFASSLTYGVTEDGNWYKAGYMASGGNWWARLNKNPVFLLFALAPRGVIYHRAESLSQTDQKMIDAITPADGIVHPDVASEAFAPWKRAQQGLPFLLRTQTLMNEGQIACALERYHLAHGTYPEALDALVPQYIEKLPHDIINGEPLHYRQTDDGKFLLYSVGWNEEDDGGNDVSRLGRPETLKQGDWVWDTASKLR